MSTEPGFLTVRTGAMKREGVKGRRAAVSLRSGRLGIVGEEGGAIWIDPADIASMRVGYSESNTGKQFHTTLVRAGRREPIVLYPITNRDPGYAATIRGLAEAIVQTGGLERIQRGSGAFWAWLGPVLTGLLFLAGLAVGVFILAADAWWQRLIPAAPGAILFPLTLWNAKARLAPRPIKALSDLDPQLP